MFAAMPALGRVRGRWSAKASHTATSHMYPQASGVRTSRRPGSIDVSKVPSLFNERSELAATLTTAAPMASRAKVTSWAGDR
jgi:hypothetical protein